MQDKTPEENEKALRIAYNKTFKSPEGKIVLADLIKEFKLLDTGFIDDQRLSDHVGGQRTVPAHICAKMGIIWKFDLEKPKKHEENEHGSITDSITSDTFDFAHTPHPLDASDAG